MTVSTYGSVNVNSLTVPDLLVQIAPPAQNFVQGAATDIIGAVGSAAWGPVNTPVVFGGYAEFVQNFGPLVTRRGDLGTFVLAASLQGADRFVGVRLTNGNDLAANVVVQTNCITFTGLYTGSLGNQIQVAITKGSQKGTTRAVISAPGLAPETFDNVPGSANAQWVNLASAINNGQSIRRGPSKIITALAGVGTTAPAIATYTLSGGVDGGSDSDASTFFVGTDGTARTGMYALRNSGASVVALVDCSDATSFTTQQAYGISEGSYMLLVGPPGDTIATATTTLATSGVDTYACKYLFGDWCYFRDQTNNKLRLISPQGFAAGRLATLSPEQSGLNKPIVGIVATQKSYLSQFYSAADLATMSQSQMDVITTPSPGGRYFSLRFGRNCSSDGSIHGDNYTRLTNYIPRSLNASLGSFVGQLQTKDQRQIAVDVIQQGLQDMWDAGQIGNAQGSVPFSVEVDDTTTSPSLVARGYEIASIKVQYASVVEFFIANFEGGQSVSITRAAAPAA